MGTSRCQPLRLIALTGSTSSRRLRNLGFAKGTFLTLSTYLARHRRLWRDTLKTAPGEDLQGQISDCNDHLLEPVEAAGRRNAVLVCGWLLVAQGNGRNLARNGPNTFLRKRTGGTGLRSNSQADSFSGLMHSGIASSPELPASVLAGTYKKEVVAHGSQELCRSFALCRC